LIFSLTSWTGKYRSGYFLTTPVFEQWSVVPEGSLGEMVQINLRAGRGGNIPIVDDGVGLYGYVV